MMKPASFFTALFVAVTEKIGDAVKDAETKRLIKLCLDVQKDGNHDKDAVRNFIGYDHDTPSGVRKNGEAVSKKDLFNSCWNKAQAETRKRIAIAATKRVYGVDFGVYKKSLPLLMVYCEAVEREMTEVRAVFSKRLAKILGVVTGKKVAVPIASIEILLAAQSGQKWSEKSAEFGTLYRAAVSKKMELRTERIEIGSFDDDVNLDEYL
jgi:hypothetical protein